MFYAKNATNAKDSIFEYDFEEVGQKHTHKMSEIEVWDFLDAFPRMLTNWPWWGPFNVMSHKKLKPHTWWYTIYNAMHMLKRLQMAL